MKRSMCPGTASSKASPEQSEMQVINPQAAGIDVGATMHFVCVPLECVPKGQSPVRRFGAFTADLIELVQWLTQCRVKTVAMESTGTYWIPLYQKLEGAGIEVVLVNARHVKNVPGRKTDLQDCQWLQKLHRCGLLRGAFRPQDCICQVRALVRHRGHLISAAAEHVQLMQKALQQMNILLHHVVSDLDGATGLRILDAILAGERDAEALLKLRDDRLRKSTPEQMKKALQGDWRPEHLFVLQQALAAYRFFQEQIQQCDRQTEALLQSAIEQIGKSQLSLAQSAPAAPEPKIKRGKRKKGAGNAPQKDFSPMLKALAGVDLSATVGISAWGALVLLSEIGNDMSRWPNEKAFASWLGLAPHHKISGGRILSNRTRPVANRAATVLRLMALAVGRTQTPLGSFYRRIQARRGSPKAITATARKLACLVYHLIKTGQDYAPPNLSDYNERLRQTQTKRLAQRAKSFGYKLVLIQDHGESVT
jgi:transposase